MEARLTRQRTMTPTIWMLRARAVRRGDAPDNQARPNLMLLHGILL